MKQRTTRTKPDTQDELPPYFQSRLDPQRIKVLDLLVTNLRPKVDGRSAWMPVMQKNIELIPEELVGMQISEDDTKYVSFRLGRNAYPPPRRHDPKEYEAFKKGMKRAETVCRIEHRTMFKWILAAVAVFVLVNNAIWYGTTVKDDRTTRHPTPPEVDVVWHPVD